MPDQLASYIAINADGTVSAFFGKMDMGQGLFVAIGQMVAEELDVPFKAVTVIMGDTATSVNQGGASGSTGIQLGGKQMRMAAAEARRVLVEMAAAKLGLPADAAHRHRRRRARQERCGEEGVLRRADRRALLQRPARLEQADRQPALCARQGQAEGPEGLQDRRQADPPRGHRAEGLCAGRLLHRRQGAGHGAWPHDPPGGRRRGAGEGRRKLDQGHPRRQSGPGQGLPRRRRRQGMGRDQGGAEAQGRVVGRQAAVPRPGRALRPHPQGAGAQARGRRQADRQCRRGVQDRRAGDRGRIRMAVPVACLHGAGLRGGRDQGRQRHLLDRLAEAALRARRHRRSSLGMPARKCAAIWVVGPGSYGRNDAGDAAMDAAVLAKAVGKPVRVQYTRDQGTGWDPKGPASIHRARAAHRRRRQRHRLRVHQQGLLPRRRATPTASKPADTLAGHFRGVDAEVGRRLRRAGGILRVRQQAHGVGDDPAAARPRLAAAQRASARSGRAADPLRQRIVHGRGGGGAQRRSDRVPPAPRQGPARHRGASRRRPRRRAGSRGPRRARTRPATRSAAAASPTRSATARACAIVAEVDVDRSTGKIWARKFTVAHDCGQIINPDRAQADASRATSCRASAARCGKRSSSTART